MDCGINSSGVNSEETVQNSNIAARERQKEMWKNRISLYCNCIALQGLHKFLTYELGDAVGRVFKGTVKSLGHAVVESCGVEVSHEARDTKKATSKVLFRYMFQVVVQAVSHKINEKCDV